MIDFFYHMTLNELEFYFWRETLRFCHLLRNVIMGVIT